MQARNALRTPQEPQSPITAAVLLRLTSRHSRFLKKTGVFRGGPGCPGVLRNWIRRITLVTAKAFGRNGSGPSFRSLHQVSRIASQGPLASRPSAGNVVASHHFPAYAKLPDAVCWLTQAGQRVE